MPKPMTPDAIKNMIRRMLVEEGWVRPVVVVIGPNCEPRVLEDEA